jgi:hypothetical protein
MKRRGDRTRTCLLSVLLLAVMGPLVLIGSTSASAGPPASPEFLVNTTTTDDQVDPSVAMDADGDYVVTWASLVDGGPVSGIYAQRYDETGAPQGGETRISTTTTRQYWPDVAMDADGDYIITWTVIANDGLDDVMARRYNADGTPQGPETRVNSAPNGTERLSSVAMAAGGDYVITWEVLNANDDIDGVYAQRYDADGTPQGGETLVTTTPGSPRFPSVAMDAEGDYVITWQSNASVDVDIYAQRYDAAGTPRGGETRVNTTTADLQRLPSVAMDADGDYVVTWQSAAGAGDIYAQRYNAAGVARGAETLVNTTTNHIQEIPSVAMDADGDYTVTWQTFGQGSSAAGIYAQRYSAAGTRQGTETRINTDVIPNKLNGEIAMDADGDSVVAWQSNFQDGDGDGVYGRRLRGPEPVDLSLSQSASSDPVGVGRRVTYRIRVANRGEPATDTGIAVIDAAIGTATGVRVVSTVPDGGTFVTSSGTGWTCTPFATTTRCRLTGPLAAGDVAPGLAVTYTAPDTAGAALHDARVYENQRDPIPANDAETERTTVLCTLEYDAPSYSQTEAAPITATVTRNGTGCGTSGVSYTTTAASATAGTDFTNVAGTLTWTDADTDLAFSIPLVNDGLDEKTEQLNLLLTNPTGALLGIRSLANGLIGDNDDPPRINFTTTSATAAEPGALLDLTVQLSEISGQDVTAVLAKAGTATYLTDYYAPKRLTIPAGQRTITFTIEIADDNTTEGTEQAVIALATPTAATLGTQKTYRLTITDDD